MLGIKIKHSQVTTIFQLFPSNCPLVTCARSYRLAWLRAPLIYARLCGWFKVKQTCDLDSFPAAWESADLRTGTDCLSLRDPHLRPNRILKPGAEGGEGLSGGDARRQKKVFSYSERLGLGIKVSWFPRWRQTGKARLAAWCHPSFSRLSGGLVLSGRNK